VLSRALGSICNGHSASDIDKYQQVTFTQTRISTVWQASNQGVGGSNPSGRNKINKLGAMFLGAVLLTHLNSTICASAALRNARLPELIIGAVRGLCLVVGQRAESKANRRASVRSQIAG
jgi:hypothetical protein